MVTENFGLVVTQMQAGEHPDLRYVEHFAARACGAFAAID